MWYLSLCGTKNIQVLYFRTNNFATKYTNAQEKDQYYHLQDLGTRKPENCPISFKFLIGLVHQKFNFLCTRLEEFVMTLNFHYDHFMPRLDTSNLGILIVDNINQYIWWMLIIMSSNQWNYRLDWFNQCSDN